MTDSTFSFEELRKVQLAEKHYSIISPLPEDFFDAYAGYIEEYKKQLEKEYSLQSAKAYESAKMIVKDVINTRLQKIILRAVRDMQGNKLNTDGLARQEKDFYLKCTSLLKEYSDAIATAKPISVLITRQTEHLDSQSSKQDATQEEVSVVISIDLPQFIGPSGVPIGPFTKGQKTQLNEKDAGLLIKRGAANKT